MGELGEKDDTTMFFVAEKQQKTILIFFFTLIKCNGMIQTMKHQKILNLLNEESDSKLVTKKMEHCK